RGEAPLIDPRQRGEWPVDEAGEIERSQQARAVGRQRLFTAGIGGADLFAVGEIVERVDAVDEDDAWLRIVVGRAHHAIPEGACVDRAIYLAVVREVPGFAALDRAYKCVGHQDR